MNGEMVYEWEGGKSRGRRKGWKEEDKLKVYKDFHQAVSLYFTKPCTNLHFKK